MGNDPARSIQDSLSFRFADSPIAMDDLVAKVNKLFGLPPEGLIPDVVAGQFCRLFGESCG
jgi:hypothetical protein